MNNAIPWRTHWKRPASARENLCRVANPPTMCLQSHACDALRGQELPRKIRDHLVNLRLKAVPPARLGIYSRKEFFRTPTGLNTDRGAGKLRVEGGYRFGEVRGSAKILTVPSP